MTFEQGNAAGTTNGPRSPSERGVLPAHRAQRGPGSSQREKLARSRQPHRLRQAAGGQGKLQVKLGNGVVLIKEC